MNNRLQVALAQQSDAPAIWNILQAEIEVMRHAGRNQWQNGYPNPQTVASDIEKGQGRVLWLGTEVVGYCALITSGDPCYDHIWDGDWLTSSLATDCRYAVVHRIGIHPQHTGKGFAAAFLQMLMAEAASMGFESMRIDPNFDNFKAFLTPAPDHWLAGQTGVKDIYYLTYTDQSSDAQILSSKPFAKAEVYDFYNNPAGEGFWAETWVPATKDKFKVNVDMSAYKRVGAPDEELVPECFIFLSDNSGTPIAIIDFKYDESAKEPSESGDMISISQGDGSVNKLTSGDIYYFINSEYSVTEVFQVAVSGAATLFKSTIAFDDVKIYSLTDDGTFKETTDGSLAVEGGANNTFYAYVGDGVPASSSWLVILKSNMVNTCALYITYTPSSSAAALVSFVYPDYVRNATLAPYTGAMLSQILSEHWGATEDVVWELKYTGEPSTCMIYVPGEPEGKAAWNNYNDATGAPYDNYWLTYEYEDKTMYVMMSEAGKTDYFVWKDPATYKPTLILVCTAVASK